MNNSPRGVARRLRRQVDGNDGFTSGHQIITLRQSNREDPEWTKSDAEIREVLRRSFPKLDTDAGQRFRAGRWMRVIQLYYRKHGTEGRIAEEMGISVAAVRSLIRSIKRVTKGVSANGTGALGRPRGRPKIVPRLEQIVEVGKP